MEHVRDRARAVVTRVLERAVPAAPAIRLGRDRVGRGDRTCHGATRGRAAATAVAAAPAALVRGSVVLLEHLVRTGHAERGPGRGSDDAVGREPMPALEAPDRAPRLGTEGAVDRDAERALEIGHTRAHAVVVLRAGGSNRGGLLVLLPQHGLSVRNAHRL